MEDGAVSELKSWLVSRRVLSELRVAFADLMGKQRTRLQPAWDAWGIYLGVFLEKSCSIMCRFE